MISAFRSYHTICRSAAVGNRLLGGEQSSIQRLLSPQLRNISTEQRAALRKARKEQATKILEGANRQGAEGTPGSITAVKGSQGGRLFMSKYIWYIALGVPTVALVWGLSDENSPPAKFSRMIGLTGLIESYTEEIVKPIHTKLLPDWSEVRSQFVPATLLTLHAIVLLIVDRCPMYRMISRSLTR